MTLCSVVQLILTYNITEKTDFSFSIRNHTFMVLMKIELSKIIKFNNSIFKIFSVDNFGITWAFYPTPTSLPPTSKQNGEKNG
jgi:hypothetical protein